MIGTYPDLVYIAYCCVDIIYDFLCLLSFTAQYPPEGATHSCPSSHTISSYPFCPSTGSSYNLGVPCIHPLWGSYNFYFGNFRICFILLVSMVMVLFWGEKVQAIMLMNRTFTYHQAWILLLYIIFHNNPFIKILSVIGLSSHEMESAQTKEETEIFIELVEIPYALCHRHGLGMTYALPRLFKKLKLMFKRSD